MRTRCRVAIASALLVVGATAAAAVPAFALDPYDPPTISCVSSGLNEITLKICAGASGAPAGVTVQWMTVADFDANGGWFDSDDPRLCKLSLSGQPSLQHPGASRWELMAGECEDIIIGDINFDETGVSGHNCGLDPLECGTDYVFRAFAHAGRRMSRSDWTADLVCSTQPCPPPPGQCTFTQGFWKTHGPAGCVTGMNTNQWPASVMAGGMTLGSGPGVLYTAAQLCCIYQKAAGGNGLVSLAHQLITAKMNLANGATNCPPLAAAIAAADALIGNLVVPSDPAPCTGGGGFLAPGGTSALTMTLDTYNNGGLCSPNCHGDGPNFGVSGTANSEKAPWGKVKVRYR